MKGKIVIQEDTFSEYLDYIYNSFHENMSKELKRQARLLTGEEGDEDTGFIAKHMSTDFNPNLFISGQEEEYWIIKNASRTLVQGGGNVSSIEAVYTGMRLHETFPPGEARVWSEFSVDGAKYELERDYAFYQETGLDPYAPSWQAYHKGAVAKGTRESSVTLFEHAAEYVYNIMRKGDGDIPPKII